MNIFRLSFLYITNSYQEHFETQVKSEKAKQSNRQKVTKISNTNREK